MKIKTEQLVAAKKAIEKLFALEGLSAAKAFEIVGMGKRIIDALALYEKTRQQLIVRLGSPVLGEDGKDTKQIQVKPENTDEFVKQLNALHEETVDLESECVEIPGDLQGLTVIDLIALDGMVAVAAA